MTICKKKRWTIFVLMIANFIVFLDASILPVALPTIQKLLHSSEEQLQWMINSYLLSLSIFVAIGGKLADIFGHRKIFSLGMFLFGISSLFCGISPTSEYLIVSRFIQGCGSALMIPSSTSLLYEAFGGNKIGKGMGLIATSGSIAFSVGPLAGGLFSEYLSWHYIFFINVPITIIGLIIT